MIEIYKHQFKYLSEIIAEIKNRNYRFIIYMDDLSFEEFEIEYKFLKAVIEGGVEYPEYSGGGKYSDLCNFQPAASDQRELE